MRGERQMNKNSQRLEEGASQKGGSRTTDQRISEYDFQLGRASG